MRISDWSSDVCSSDLAIFHDFTLTSDGIGSYANHEYDPLESAFLEPETVGLLDMYTQRGDQVASPRQEPLDETKIFSAPELRNGVRLIQAAYECSSEERRVGKACVSTCRYLGSQSHETKKKK